MTQTQISHLHIICSACGHRWNRDLRPMLGAPQCPACRNFTGNKVVKARMTEQECGGKCQTAKGGICDCSCGGENHGAAA